MKLKLSPSILSADFCNLGEQVREAENALDQHDYIHIDVMDGLFVPSISFGFPVIEALRPRCGHAFDVHLMINEPIRYVERFAKAGADIITVHAEACSDLKATLRAIRDLGVKCAISVNPETSVDFLEDYLNKIDMVLLMTVHPGFGGQSYIDEVTDKIRKVRHMIDESGRYIELEVDGGIYEHNIRTVIDAGADVIVCGSAVFKGSITRNIEALRNVFTEYQKGDI